ncbi:Dynein heavy chain 7, axonemal [Cladochytrium tenue]|nr:Dynein heavy chain 7, axonemal [Cladochytrium tenue]
MEKDKNLEVLKPTDPDYAPNLKNEITFGPTVLLENFKEELNPIFDTVLWKHTFKSGGSPSIRLVDAVIEYTHSFCLYIYITTKLRNTKAQGDRKDQILQILSSAKGNILENEPAIEEFVEDIVDRAVREWPRKRSARLTRRATLAGIVQSNISSILKCCLKNFEAYFTYSPYCNICRSLFEKYKLLFSFLLCACILRSRAELDPREFAFFIFGAVGVAAAADPGPT